MRNSCSAMISDEKRWTNIMTNMFLTNQWETLSEQLLSTSYIFEPWLQNISFRWIERLYFDYILVLFWLYLNYILMSFLFWLYFDKNFIIFWNPGCKIFVSDELKDFILIIFWLYFERKVSGTWWHQLSCCCSLSVGKAAKLSVDVFLYLFWISQIYQIYL